MNHTRRRVLATTGAVFLAPLLEPLLASASAAADPLCVDVATNTYPWLTFARRNDQPFVLHTDSLLSQIATTGIRGYEPIVTEVDELEGLAARLQKHSLQMKSMYVNSTLHDETVSAASVAKVIAISKAARALGTQVVVTNPAPIRWGGNEDKNDQQLRHQAKMLDQLGAELRRLGMVLAYHNHDAELRQGGREFHHMLTATNSENVKLCLDAHWIYRGCGNSAVAVFDAVEHYHKRIVELHLRQSIDGIWTEDFRLQGDIDYPRLLRFLQQKKIVAHLVLEQAVEEKSPNQLTVVEAHRLGRENLSKFA